MKYLRDIRNRRGVSQQDVATYLGISRQAYSNYETGAREPDFETLLKLGEYFDVTVDDILTGEKPHVESDLAEYLTDLRDRPETRALLEASRGMTKEQVEAMAAFAKQLRGDPFAD